MTFYHFVGRSYSNRDRNATLCGISIAFGPFQLRVKWLTEVEIKADALGCAPDRCPVTETYPHMTSRYQSSAARL